VSAEPEATEAQAESSAGAQAERTEEPEAREPEEVEQESEREEEAEASPSPTPTATQTQAPEPEVVGYTLAEVAQKNTSADCWVAIDGGVYDLTMWIRSHPGGSGAITQLCGKDGTSQFLSMHGGQSRPASTLDSYYIGPLR
jgi:cytochrome b involved in lipid metabolism